MNKDNDRRQKISRSLVLKDQKRSGKVMELVPSNAIKSNDVILEVPLSHTDETVKINKDVNIVLEELKKLKSSDIIGIDLEHNVEIPRLSYEELNNITTIGDILRCFSTFPTRKHFINANVCIKSLGLAILYGTEGDRVRKCRLFDIHLMNDDGSECYYPIYEIIKILEAWEDYELKEHVPVNLVKGEKIKETIEMLQKLKAREPPPQDSVSGDKIEELIKIILELPEMKTDLLAIDIMSGKNLVRLLERIKKILNLEFDQDRLNMTINLLEIFEILARRLSDRHKSLFHNGLFDLFLLYYKLFISSDIEVPMEEHFIKWTNEIFKNSFHDTKFIVKYLDFDCNHQLEELFKMLPFRKLPNFELIETQQSQFGILEENSSKTNCKVEDILKPHFAGFDALMTIILFVHLEKKIKESEERETNDLVGCFHFKNHLADLDGNKVAKIVKSEKELTKLVKIKSKNLGIEKVMS